MKTSKISRELVYCKLTEKSQYEHSSTSTNLYYQPQSLRFDSPLIKINKKDILYNKHTQEDFMFLPSSHLSTFYEERRQGEAVKLF